MHGYNSGTPSSRPYRSTLLATVLVQGERSVHGAALPDLTTLPVILQLRVSLHPAQSRHGVYRAQIYALYERSRKILIFLLVMCSLEVAAMAALVGITMSELSRKHHLPILCCSRREKRGIREGALITFFCRSPTEINTYWVCISRDLESLSPLLDPGPYL